MSDAEKARFILNLLASQELKLQGAREAFSFTECYRWLVELSKKIEQGEKDAN
jgi:hypothetical protein